MYVLSRTKKMRRIIGGLCVLMFLCSIVSFFGGGSEVFGYDSMNEPFKAILMTASFLGGIILYVIMRLSEAIENDMKEQLRCMDQRMQENMKEEN